MLGKRRESGIRMRGRMEEIPGRSKRRRWKRLKKRMEERRGTRENEVEKG